MLFLLLLFWSAILGWGLSQVTLASSPVGEPTAVAQVEAPSAPAAAPSSSIGTVDPVPEKYRLGQQYYLETCASCHVGLPPAVMPSQTWADLLQDSQHYGVQIQPLGEPLLQIVWSYVSTYSRPIIERERVPYRLSQSRYFKALHPKVEFAEPISVNSCAACHPAAAQFNYRSLTPEWQNAP